MAKKPKGNEKKKPNSGSPPGSLPMGAQAAELEAPPADASSSSSREDEAPESPRRFLSEPLRIPFRTPRAGRHQRHVEVVLDARQAMILAGLVDGVVPRNGEPVVTLRNGRVIGAGPSNTADAVRWLIEQLDQHLPEALKPPAS